MVKILDMCSILVYIDTESHGRTCWPTRQRGIGAEIQLVAHLGTSSRTLKQAPGVNPVAILNQRACCSSRVVFLRLWANVWVKVESARVEGQVAGELLWQVNGRRQSLGRGSSVAVVVRVEVGSLGRI